MIIFLYGNDRYRLLQNRDLVVQKFKDKHGVISVQTVDGAAGDASAQFKAGLANNSFFNDIQLVIVQDIFANQASAEKIGELLKQYDALNDKQRIVVAVHPGSRIASGSADKKTRNSLPGTTGLWELLVNKRNLVREFTDLDEVQFEKWLKKEATDRGVSFAPGAARQLIGLIGTDSWRAINELEKLSHYCGQTITAQAVAEIVSADQEPQVFAFIDALGSGNRARALELLHRELSLRQDPYYLLSMVAYQFRTMLMVHDAASRSKNTNVIAEETGLKPFVIRKMLPVVAKYSADDLKKIYQSLCDLELGAKQGTHNLEDALYQFVLKPL